MTTEATPIRTTAPREPHEPAPDPLDHRVVHRATTTDLARLARVADELVRAPGRRRLRLLRRYLRGISAEIVHHHRVRPPLETVAVDRAVLVPLTQDHERLGSLLARAGELAAVDTAAPQLAATLHELADLLARHAADEERDVVPITGERVRVEDRARSQERFRAPRGSPPRRSSRPGSPATRPPTSAPRSWPTPHRRCGSCSPSPNAASAPGPAGCSGRACPPRTAGRSG
jgi:hypothetical protein